MLNFYIFPYRDLYFQSQFGPIVRDLMMIKTIIDLDVEKNVHIFNRPVSVYERLLTKKIFESELPDFVKVHDVTSFDLIGPLRGRSWCEHAYSNTYNNIVLDADSTNIILDFLPIGYLPKWTENADYYWYDFIDNFVKHNRYTDSQKMLVKEKYNHVNEKKNSYFTAVKKGIIQTERPYLEVLNALTKPVEYHAGPFDFDFGFIGFTTDKFDISLIELITGLGFTVGVFGQSYCQSTTKKLEGIENVSVFGSFVEREVPGILKRFKVGLVPYLKEKMHDESPLKIYQYISSGKHVLSTSDFGLVSEFIVNLDGYKVDDMVNAIVSIVNKPNISSLDAEGFAANNSWSSRVNNIFGWMLG
jgi:hypothetical protein